MKRIYLYTVVLLLSALMITPLAQVSSAAAPQVEVRHTIIAASGSAAPGGGTYTPLLFNATVNASHQVAFDAFLNGAPATTGVFVGDGTTTSTIALGGNPDPPSFGNVFNPFITPRAVNDHGVISYFAFLSGTTATQAIF